VSDAETVYESEIFPQLTVAIIYPESAQYELLSQQFKKSGHAFLLRDHDMIVVDGGAVGQSWFTPDHLLVIQAHEAGHYMAGHRQDAHASRDEALEREADWLGYNLLKQKGETSAADIHSQEYEARYDAPPADHDELMTHLKKHLGESIQEKKLRGKKTKRVLYHIGRRPAEPKPKMKWLTDWDSNAIDPKTGEKGDFVRIGVDDAWRRWWIEGPIKSGVFLSPNPNAISSFHGRTGHVYAYKVPQWVIAKSGGVHRFDHGSEILIPEDVWNEAGDEIEFLGKSMDENEVFRQYDLNYARSAVDAVPPGADVVPQAGVAPFNLQGLRSSQHPEDVIKLLTSEERKKAIAAIKKKYEEKSKGLIIPAKPGERKGMKIRSFDSGLDKKDQELMDLLQKHMNEAALREHVRGLLAEENVLAMGMCFPFTYQKAKEWFDQHIDRTKPRGKGVHPDLDNKDKFKVVHGTVTDKWKKPSKPVVHAWVEMGDLVFDDQTKFTKPDGIDREFYYDMYQPDPKKEYTATEVMANCVRHGGEGPWDEGLYTMMQQRDAWLKEYVQRVMNEEADDEPSQDALEAYMQEYESIAQENPIDWRARYFVMGKTDDGKYCLVQTSLQIFDEAINMGSIQTTPPGECEGKGYASKVMQRLVDLADKHGVVMSLDPYPFGQKTLGVGDLKGWYKRVGFKPDRNWGGEWRRKPLAKEGKTRGRTRSRHIKIFGSRRTESLLKEGTELGDCYEAAGKYMMDNCMIGDCDLVLVHGEVSGQGSLEGVRYGHAWVEDGDTVIDKSNGRDLRVPKAFYYTLGQISSETFDNEGYSPMGGQNVHKYTWEEAREKIIESEHWGPWDLETSTGL